MDHARDQMVASTVVQPNTHLRTSHGLLSEQMNVERPIVVTGAAGLVGQNLLLMLAERGYRRLIALDKHAGNLKLLSKLVPIATVETADLSTAGSWERHLDPDTLVVVLHSQITSTAPEQFVRNNITATSCLLEAVRRRGSRFLVHVSSSVVVSIADDDYTRTKRGQEDLVRASPMPHCVLRPTLMFGWFDPKHFGWLSRFMERAPLFPIPGDGAYVRQPLYIRDFCRALIWCIENEPRGRVYDIVGAERIQYVEIIRHIKLVKGLRTPIVHIPYGLFDFLLRLYARFNATPPFTSDQLKALAAGDEFTGVDTEREFGFRQTRFADAIRETFCDTRYSKVVVER
jgi:nucleoside-diphosphate-sugar epimerase